MNGVKRWTVGIAAFQTLITAYPVGVVQKEKLDCNLTLIVFIRV